MDENLTNFVGLLNQHRQARPLNDEFDHLPDWARRALQELPEPSRQAAPAARSAPKEAEPSAELEAKPAFFAAMNGEPIGGVGMDVLERPSDVPPPAAMPPLSESPVEPLPEQPSSVDFAALLATVETPAPDDAEETNDSEAVDPLTDATTVPVAHDADAALPAAQPGGRKLVYALVPLLAVAVAAVGGGIWLTRKPATPLPHAAPSQAKIAVPAVAVADAARPKVAAPATGAENAPVELAIKSESAAKSPAAPKRVAAAIPPVKAAAPVAAKAQPVGPSELASATGPAASGKIAAAAALSPAKVSAKPKPVAIATEGVPSKVSSDTQVAMLGPPGLAPLASPSPEARPAPLGADAPAWLRYAVPAPPYIGEPRIAIVIDDLGIDKRRTERAIALSQPVTLSFLAYADDLAEQTAAARRAGHELMIHVPMDPVIRPTYLGLKAAPSQLTKEETLRRLNWDLGRFTGYVGVNDHVGSQLSSDPTDARTVMEVLKQRGLLFLDSRGADSGGVVDVAQHLGVPTATRDLFLDDDVGAPAIDARLADLEKLAKARGTAIALCHPHDRTLDALTVWLANLPARGFQLVPLTAIVKQREHLDRVD